MEREIVLTFSAQSIITAAAVIAAVVAIAGYIFKARDWVKKQDKQEKDIKALAEHHEEDMRASLEERQLMVEGLFACLKGLQEQGCNGPVTKAIAKFEDYLNKKAHE